MSNQNEIIELKQMVNQLNVELLKAKLQHQAIYSSIIPSLEKLHPGIEHEIYTNALKYLETHTQNALKSLEPLLFDVGDPQFLFRQMFQSFLDLSAMRQDLQAENTDD